MTRAVALVAIAASCGYPQPTHVGDGGASGDGDAPSGTWGSATSLPVARSEVAATLGSIGEIYALGGYSSPDDQTDSVFVIDVNDGSDGWQSSAAMPTARYGLAATDDTSGRIYAIGGATLAMEDLATVEVFTLTGSAAGWATAPSLTVSRYSLAATTGADDRLYAIGGTHEGQPTASAEVYVQGSASWTPIAAMPTPRSGLAAVATDDPSNGQHIYAIGGGDAVNGPSQACESYSPTTNTWQPCAVLPTPRSGLAAVVGPDGRIYAIGGRNAQAQILATVEAYDPKTNMWTTMTSLPDPRADAAAVLGPDNRIYVIGGTNPEVVQTSVEAFTP